ncbi:Trk system potassium transporter TrkA [Desulfoferrobacter suflitae]|uniref:Trk system potassium transporter TrkA n=1 Tax=Desulfoferrobacter suflitae TaxID=2865782 RepID=UPI002164A849|nr:Trk system potassium transporter TrkA [Desulfoferrobacter suflitae]MCK8600994.1 Trk system potassium transporter TrkA [Desulfoferrobacter suflitae]
MRIIIVGAGEVGFHIAQRLAYENKEVVVIDKRAEALRRFTDLLDVQTLQGSGSSPSILEEAGIRGADTFLAVTDSDETNLVACLFANALEPGIVKLARIRDEDYTHHWPELVEKSLDIHTVINPEIEVVRTIEKSLAVPDAEHVSDFADGRVKLVGLRIGPSSPIAGIRLQDLRQKTGALRFLIAAIFRNERLIIPGGKDRIRAQDLVYFVCEADELRKVLRIFGSKAEPIRNILIVGGGNIGMRLALQLETKPYHIRLIEQDMERCNFLAAALNSTIVLHGDGTDRELLEEENIREIDVAISLTGNEEANVLSSLLAKSLGAKRTMTRINKFHYMPIIGAIGLGQIVSPRLSAINSIILHVRKGKVLSAVSLKGEEAEVLEAVALETSGIVGTPLKDLRFPKGAIVLAILQDEKSIIPDGESIVRPGDRVIILSTRKNISRVEQELMVKLEYF